MNVIRNWEQDFNWDIPKRTLPQCLSHPFNSPSAPNVVNQFTQLKKFWQLAKSGTRTALSVVSVRKDWTVQTRLNTTLKYFANSVMAESLDPRVTVSVRGLEPWIWILECIWATPKLWWVINQLTRITDERQESNVFYCWAVFFFSIWCTQKIYKNNKP